MKRLLTILLIFYAPASIACSCDWLGDFFEAIKQTDPDLIIKGKVVAKIADNGFNMKMNVAVIKTFKGQNVTKLVTIWGDQGADCRPYISQFKIGDIYYLALHEYDSSYELIICGEHFAKAGNGIVWSDLEVRDGLNVIGKMKESEFVRKLNCR